MGQDDISLRTIKQAQSSLEPLLLHMVNQIIRTKVFPEVLKTSKVVPIPKQGKDPNTADGWRPINVVIALAKIVERVFLQQMLKHMEDNALIAHSHHGSVKRKSTQTLVNGASRLVTPGSISRN